MSERREYTMTQAQLDTILEACQPTPVMYGTGGMPLFNTPQENANRAWIKLGVEMGFKGMTVEPTTKGDLVFTAEPIDPPQPEKRLDL